MRRGTKDVSGPSSTWRGAWTALAAFATAFPAGASEGFVENKGQWPAEVSHAASDAGLRAWVGRSGWVLDLAPRRGAELGLRCALRVDLDGGRARGVRPEAVQPGLRHYLLGEERVRDARSFGRLVLEESWPGIDVVLREEGVGLAYDLELEAGADLAAAGFVVRGALGLALDGDELVIQTALGELRQSAPVAWRTGPGSERVEVPVRFVLRDEACYGFEVLGEVPAGAWVLDPGIEWSSYLGAFDEDRVHDVAFAQNGDVVVTGTTLSFEFPNVVGAYQPHALGARDAFVSRFRHDGSRLIFSTRLGGSADDEGTALALRPGGEVWICGDTASVDFPVSAGAAQPTHQGGSDAFVAHLGPSGATLLGSTFLGASGEDHARDLVLDPAGSPRVAGWTDSGLFPVTLAAFDVTPGGGRDAFVAGWSADLSSLSFASFFGGSGQDAAHALALGPGGELVLGGESSSASLPTTPGVLDPTHNPGGTSPRDGFVAQLSADAGLLHYASYLGGGGSDVVEALAVEPGGELWLVGGTESTDFPVSAGAIQSGLGGLEDAFVVRLASGATALLHGSYLGGGERDTALDLVLTQGGAAVVGSTASVDFPRTSWGFDASFNSAPGSGARDGFVVRVDGGGALDYAAFLGGLDDDVAEAIASDGQGDLVVGGATNSYNFPTTFGVFDRIYDLSYIFDGFVTRLDLDHYPFNFGAAKINSQSSWAVLGYGGFPSVSAGDFSIYIDGGIPFSFGFLFWSDQPGGGPFMGGTLHMAPPYTRTPLLNLDWFGSTEVAIPADAALVGTTRYYQAWYADPTDPFGVGLSDALSVTFYP